MPRISVIIPTHSRPHLLPRTVASARAAGTDVEIIVVDDASRDDTAEVCKNLENIKYVRLDRNQGVAGARNIGLMHSQGNYISFLDDDDLRLPGSLDLQARTLDAHPEAGFVCGAMVMADQDYRPTGEVTHPNHPGGDVFWKMLELDFPVMGLSTLIRRECFLRIGLLRRNLIGIDDWDIFIRLAELYPAVVIEEPVGLYRQPTPQSDQGSSARAAQLNRAARHQLRLLRLPRAMALPAKERRAIRRRLINRIADTLLWSAARHLPRGDFAYAYENIAVAIRLNPFRAARPGAYRKLWQTLLAERAGN
ncbi:MAG TPA: glycosyltransferase family 2 protein [Pyrinomonadaceae bacterium]|nr:glycosyltransferase family 2 protein [Pyrinomonadaceae bacterium]